MKKRIYRPFRELVCLFSSLLFAFPIAAFFTTVFIAKDPGYTYALICWPLALCHIAGSAPLGENRALRLGSFILSAALCLLTVYFMLPEKGTVQYVFLGFLLIPAVFCYILGAKSALGFPPAFSVAGIVMYLAEMTIFSYSFGLSDAISPLTVCAMAFFLLSLYSFNSAGLYSGLHSVKTDASAPLPPGLMSRNMLLLTGFIIIAMLISVFEPFRLILGGIYSALTAAIRFLAGLINTGSDTAPVSTPDTVAAPVQELPAAQEEGGMLWLYIVVSVLIAALVIALTVYILNSFSGSGRKSRGIPEWLKRLFSRKSAPQDYEDDVENLFNLSEFLSSGGKKLRAVFSRPRPQSFGDMANDEMRVRFAYKALLKARGELSKTPLEHAALEDDEAAARLCRSYSDIKYAQRPAAPEDGSAALGAMNALKREQKK